MKPKYFLCHTMGPPLPHAGFRIEVSSLTHVAKYGNYWWSELTVRTRIAEVPPPNTVKLERKEPESPAGELRAALSQCTWSTWSAVCSHFPRFLGLRRPSVASPQWPLSPSSRAALLPYTPTGVVGDRPIRPVSAQSGRACTVSNPFQL